MKRKSEPDLHVLMSGPVLNSLQVLTDGAKNSHHLQERLRLSKSLLEALGTLFQLSLSLKPNRLHLRFCRGLESLVLRFQLYQSATGRKGGRGERETTETARGLPYLTGSMTVSPACVEYIENSKLAW